MLNDVEILIKSFLRKQCVINCIDSIRTIYPDITISVCDDGDIEHLDGVDNFYKLPYYSGHSVGLNYLVSMCKKPYFFVCDDDMIFTKDTKLDILYRVITGQKNIGAVGLRIFDLKTGFHKTGPGALKVTYDQVEGRIIKRIFYGPRAPLHVIDGIQCMPCRMIPHSFMGNTRLFREWGVHWRDELKRCSHLPFFLDFPKKLKIYFVNDCVLTHNHLNNDEYDRFKNDDLYKRMTCERKVVYGYEYQA